MWMSRRVWGYRPKLLNAIQHGRLNPKQIEFAKKRIGAMVCAQCFAGKHGHLPGFEEKEGGI